MINKPYLLFLGDAPDQLATNTTKLTEAAVRQLLLETEDRTGLPCVDAVRTGVWPLVALIVG